MNLFARKFLDLILDEKDDDEVEFEKRTLKNYIPNSFREMFQGSPTRLYDSGGVHPEQLRMHRSYDPIEELAMQLQELNEPPAPHPYPDAYIAGITGPEIDDADYNRRFADMESAFARELLLDPQEYAALQRRINQRMAAGERYPQRERDDIQEKINIRDGYPTPGYPIPR